MQYSTIMGCLPKGVRHAARELGISPTTVCRLRRGEMPDPKTALALARWAGANEITFTVSDLSSLPTGGENE
jgi:transcriptional regulator with XRE-family HTH domain